MGASASIGNSDIISKDRVKEIAGENWSEALETRYNIASDKKDGGNILITEMKWLAPQLFVDVQITEDEAKHLLTYCEGKEWNDELTVLFKENATAHPVVGADEAPTDAAEGKILLTAWAALVPTLFETEEDKKVRMEAEYQAMLARRAEGTITCNYFMDDITIPVSKNSLTAEAINEEFGLYDVMPGCRILLSTIDSKARTSYENAHIGQVAPFVREDPIGTFQELLCDEKYFIIVKEDAKQYEKDMATQREKNIADGKPEEEDGARAEGCSCLYGNPCVDQYICKDWDHRMEVAKKNGK